MPELLTPAEIRAQLRAYPDWTLGDDAQLHAAMQFKNFAQVMLFVNAIAHLAEVADHHPDLLIHGWNKLAIALSTHSVGGITALDFALIAQIDGLPRSRA